MVDKSKVIDFVKFNLGLLDNSQDDHLGIMVDAATEAIIRSVGDDPNFYDENINPSVQSLLVVVTSEAVMNMYINPSSNTDVDLFDVVNGYTSMIVLLKADYEGFEEEQSTTTTTTLGA